MSRSTRRLALALAAPLLLTALVACGDDTGDASSAGGLDTVTVEGNVGSAPKVTFDGQVEVSEIETDTVITGDGEIELAKDAPPQTTRAKLRGDFIAAAQAAGRDFTVDWVHLKLNDQAQRTVLCKDPFRSVDERVDRLIASL